MVDFRTQPFGKRSGPQQAALYYAEKRRRAAIDAGLVDDLASKAWGTITFSVNPGSSDTITLGGTAVTFGPGHNVAIGATLADTLASLVTFLNASADTNISKCTYRVSGNALGIEYDVPGVATFTLAASAATRSAATLLLKKI